MKRTDVAIMAVLCCLPVSCNLSDLTVIDGGQSENTFIQMEEAVEEPSDFSFLLLTDPHFTRTDSGVWYAQDEFFDWLDSYQTATADSLGLMVCLGDCTDSSLESEFEQYGQFVEQVMENGVTTCHSVKGNHDIRQDEDSATYWEEIVGEEPYQAFAYHGLSFYLLDTSAMTLGRTQLNQLAEALPQDSRPKIFCSHMPLYGKAELVYFCLPDTQEREEILALMAKNRGGIYVSGHQHFGDFGYRYTDTMAEFVAGAFHGRTSVIETTIPRWYVCGYDASASTLSITRYQVKKDTREVEESLLETYGMPVGGQ
jgi:predicted phosphodiesterase